MTSAELLLVSLEQHNLDAGARTTKERPWSTPSHNGPHSNDKGGFSTIQTSVIAQPCSISSLAQLLGKFLIQLASQEALGEAPCSRSPSKTAASAVGLAGVRICMLELDLNLRLLGPRLGRKVLEEKYGAH